MRDMKNSGIEWIGKMPEKWEVYRFKDISSLYTGNSIKDELKQFFEDSNDAKPYIASKDVNLIYNEINYENGIYVKNNDRRFRIAPKDATLMCIEGGSAGKKKALLSKDVCFVNKLCCFNPTTKIDKDFLFYFLNNPSYEDEFKLNISGLIGGVSVSKLKNLKLCLPPLQKQIIISAYLNRKCSEINALRLEIEQEIATLKEYKKSIITEAVTKGLNKNVPMKDSGIEWIMKIPKSWNVSKIKYLFKLGKGLNITKEKLIDEGLPIISYGQIHSKLNNGTSLNSKLFRFVDFSYKKYHPQCKINKYDFVFADTSEDYDGCGNCSYKRDDNLVYAGYHSIILKSNKKEDNRYLAYLFQTDSWRKQIRASVSGVKVFSITQSILSKASIILPLKNEQKQIADYLDRKCSKIDDIIEAKNKQLSTLDEYKKSLIYEYVTGKKEVPSV